MAYLAGWPHVSECPLPRQPLGASTRTPPADIYIYYDKEIRKGRADKNALNAEFNEFIIVSMRPLLAGYNVDEYVIVEGDSSEKTDSRSAIYAPHNGLVSRRWRRQARPVCGQITPYNVAATGRQGPSETATNQLPAPGHLRSPRPPACLHTVCMYGEREWGGGAPLSRAVAPGEGGRQAGRPWQMSAPTPWPSFAQLMMALLSPPLSPLTGLTQPRHSNENSKLELSITCLPSHLDPSNLTLLWATLQKQTHPEPFLPSSVSPSLTPNLWGNKPSGKVKNLAYSPSPSGSLLLHLQTYFLLLCHLILP